MKIGLVVPGFSADESDWCIPALLDLARALSRRHSVHVFALRYPRSRAHRMVHGIPVHAIGGGRAVGLRRVPLLAAAIRAVVAEGRRAPFDALHAFWADEPGLVATAAGRVLRTPAIVSLAGGELVGLRNIDYGGQLSRANRWMIRRALAAADRVTVGSGLLREMAGTHGAPSATLLPLGVDTTRFTASSRHDRPRSDGSPLRVLHVGSLTAVKDQATLLRAFARVVEEEPDVVLRLAGDGPLRAPLEDLAVQLGVTGRVELLGHVKHGALPELYRDSDVFALSSRFESQSLAALEAAACGTPVVGTRVGLIPEIAPPELAAPVGDARSLASVLLHLLRDREGRAVLAREQEALVRSEYALREVVTRLEAMYAAAGSRRLSDHPSGIESSEPPGAVVPEPDTIRAASVQKRR